MQEGPEWVNFFQNSIYLCCGTSVIAVSVGMALVTQHRMCHMTETDIKICRMEIRNSHMICDVCRSQTTQSNLSRFILEGPLILPWAWVITCMSNTFFLIRLWGNLCAHMWIKETFLSKCHDLGVNNTDLILNSIQ